jgi:hypothetical protein
VCLDPIFSGGASFEFLAKPISDADDADTASEAEGAALNKELSDSKMEALAEVFSLLSGVLEFEDKNGITGISNSWTMPLFRSRDCATGLV